MNSWTNLKVQYQNSNSMMRWNGHCAKHLHDGGVHIRRLLETGTNVEGGCAGDLEVSSVEREPGSQDEAVCAPICVDGCRCVLCEQIPN